MRIAIFGEGMLEMSQPEHTGQNWQLGFGGDTLNTAIHLARFGLAPTFITALGNDVFSDDLCEKWAAQGLNIQHILKDRESMPGLYAIRTDSSGERSFFYWRSASAARRIFSLPGIDEALEFAAEADLFYLSLISLAIIPERERECIYALCSAIRDRGGRVAFDSNYRPQLWENSASARGVIERMASQCDIGLPTASDEALLFGTTDASGIAARWHDFGTTEVAVKLGAEGCLVSAQGHQHMVAALPDIQPIDTSGAGDAFNAGYLAGRLREQDSYAAAVAGHRLAGWVVACHGALPAASPAAPYA